MKQAKQVEMNCPICKTPLTTVRGDSINPVNGFTLYCANAHGNEPGQCTAQEVSGHGKTVNDAFEVVTEKFRFALGN